ncbi:MAG: GAF domain-containing protein [Chloroflexota bacterium]
MNDAYLRQSGYTREEILNMRISDMEPTETQREVKGHIEKIIQQGSDIFESMHRAKDGRAWPVEVSASFAQARDGRLFAFLRDISERRQAAKKIERRIQQLKALSEIDRTIVSTFDLSFSLGILLQHVIASLEVSAADVLLFHPDSHMLEYAAAAGFHTQAVERTRIQLGEGYAGRAALERTTMYILNLADQTTGYLGVPRLGGEKFVSYFAVPLIAKGMTKGVLEVFHRSPLQPDTEWLEFLHALAGQAAIAIDNAQLFDGLQRSNLELAVAYDATIVGWSRAMDLRDKETEGHTRRVTELTLRLADILGVSAAEKSTCAAEHFCTTWANWVCQTRSCSRQMR